MKRHASDDVENIHPSKRLERSLSELTLNEPRSKVTGVFELDDENNPISKIEVNDGFLAIPREVSAPTVQIPDNPGALVLYRPLKPPNVFADDEPQVESPDVISDNEEDDADYAQDNAQIMDVDE